MSAPAYGRPTGSSAGSEPGPGDTLARVCPGRPQDGSHHVVWINPSRTDFAGTSVSSFAERLTGRATLTLKGLEVWGVGPGEPYDMRTEVDGVAHAARAAGLNRYHLFGFSAGGTVALAAALALGDAILTVTVLEPAFIGDDDWDPVEARWRSGLSALWDLEAGERTAAFRRMLMRPGEPVPPPRAEPPAWDAHDRLLEDMLERHTGFTSDDLRAVAKPTLVITGGRSDPRWELVAARLIDVMPDARAEVFPDLHHFNAPFRAEPERLADVLTTFWDRAPDRRVARLRRRSR
jgi:pimeloyl-ACP methyl ester carboxylesterase